MTQRGFTLIEITIATALLATGMLTAVSSYTAISKLQQKGQAVRTVQQSSRYMLDQIERDVRNAATVAPCPDQACAVPAASGTPVQIVKLTNSQDATSKGEEYVYQSVGGRYDLLRCDYTGGSCTAVSDQNVHVLCPGGVTPPSPCNLFTYYKGTQPFLKIDMTVSYDPSLSNYNTYFYSYDLSTVVSPRDQ
jgi:prepilin-type N-terminal cleavage/methylation domain-containing protein